MFYLSRAGERGDWVGKAGGVHWKCSPDYRIRHAKYILFLLTLSVTRAVKRRGKAITPLCDITGPPLKSEFDRAIDFERLL